MKGAAALLVLYVTVAQCSHDMKAGGWVEQDPESDPKYMELVHFAIGANTRDLTHYHAVLKLLRVKTQVVSGTNYELTFEISKSNCAIADGPYSKHKCRPTHHKASGICTAVIYEIPWKNHKELESIQCH
uniref:Cystatin n=1 Tax=Rhipicephalus appendiculatus TaxID=34631 RepID=A0A131YQ78_RHIAP